MRVDWEAFKTWLQASYGQRTWKDYLNYSQRYYEYQSDKPLSELMIYKRDKRLRILKALISLSKFLGVYPQFKQRMQAFGIRWQMPSALEIFNNMLSKSREDISRWVREVASELPDLRDFLEFARLTGLRKGEALNAYNLVIRLVAENRLGDYYNSETGCLEHFRFPALFIRPTKNAFISVTSEELLQRVAKNPPLTSAMINKRLQRSGHKIKTNLIRSAWATFMQRQLTQPEVDLLQGRVNQSVFMRYYFAPNFNELKQRVLTATEELAKN